MRIAHVTATFPPYTGGTGNVCFHNTRALAHRGYEMHVFTALTAGGEREEMTDTVFVHRMHPLLRFGNALLLPKLLKELRDFDIIHLHYPFFGGELTALAARLHCTPLVITYHQDVLLSGWMARIEKALRMTAGQATLRSASRVLFTSLDYGQASYARSLLRGREAVVGELPNGVDTARFFPAEPPQALQERYKNRPGAAVVLLVAGLDRAHYFKGVDIFLQALALLPENVSGVIVGDGDLRCAYEAQASALGLAGRIFFTGRVPDVDLPDYYRLADVTVLPSVTMGEAFGLVLLESMACGTPVIASRLPGVRTVVNDGVDGYLVQPGQATDLSEKLNRMLADPQRREEMRRCGRMKVVEKYDWSRITDRLEEEYARVLASSSGQGSREAGRLHG